MLDVKVLANNVCWVVIENKPSSFIEAAFAENGNSQLSANNQTGSRWIVTENESECDQSWLFSSSHKH